MNATLTIATFTVGFLSGYLVRKNWYIFRSLLKFKSNNNKKDSNNKKSTPINSSNSEGVTLESSESKNVYLFLKS